MTRVPEYEEIDLLRRRIENPSTIPRLDRLNEVADTTPEKFRTRSTNPVVDGQQVSDGALMSLRDTSSIIYEQTTGQPKSEIVLPTSFERNLPRLIRIERLRRLEQKIAEQAVIRDNFLPLRDFARSAWEVVEPRRKFVSGWHIDAIADHLTALVRGDIRNLIINIAPRHMKSLMVSVFFPVWVWTFMPEYRWLFASYAQTLSTRDNVKCRDIIQSPWYQQRWGQLFQLRDDYNQKTRFANTRTGHRIALSVGGPGTGEGGDCLVVDDAHNMKHIHSPVRREEVISWWNTVMSSRLDDPETGHKVIIAQRGHQRDLVGSLLAKMEEAARSPEIDYEAEDIDEYEVLILPTEYIPSAARRATSIGFVDPRTKEGELIWPERFSRRHVDGLKSSLGEFSTAAQLQQNPVPAGGGIFKIEKFKCWVPADQDLGPAIVYDQNNNRVELEVVPLPERPEREALSTDCAFKDLEGSSYVVLQRWQNNGPNYYLLNQVRDHLDFTKTVTMLEASILRWPDARLRLVEEKANGAAVINSLTTRFSGIIPVNPTEGKVPRAYAIQPIQETGNIVIPHPRLAPWLPIWIAEVISFPFAADDDQVDSMTQVINYWESGPRITVPDLPDEEEVVQGVDSWGDPIDWQT